MQHVWEHSAHTHTQPRGRNYDGHIVTHTYHHLTYNSMCRIETRHVRVDQRGSALEWTLLYIYLVDMSCKPRTAVATQVCMIIQVPIK